METLVQLRLRQIATFLDVKQIKHSLKMGDPKTFTLDKLEIDNVATIFATQDTVSIIIKKDDYEPLRPLAHTYFQHGQLNLPKWYEILGRVRP